MRGVLPKPTILELDEYDINQRIIEALTNTCSHAILFSIVDEEKDAIQIAGQLRISLSSVYKTLVNLEKLSLIVFCCQDLILEIVASLEPSSMSTNRAIQLSPITRSMNCKITASSLKQAEITQT